MTSKLPPTPAHLDRRAREFWRRVSRTYVLEVHQLELLRRACELMDVADRAGSILKVEGLTVIDRFNQVKAHPAVEIQRQAILALARVLRELNLDVGVPDSRPPSTLGYGG